MNEIVSITPDGPFTNLYRERSAVPARRTSSDKLLHAASSTGGGKGCCRCCSIYATAWFKQEISTRISIASRSRAAATVACNKAHLSICSCSIRYSPGAAFGRRTEPR